MKIVKINFFNNLFDDGGMVPDFIRSINNKKSKELIYQSSKKDKYTNSKCNNVYSVRLIPDYLKLNTDEFLSTKTVTQENKGYAIDLAGFNSAEACIKNIFKKNASQIFKRKERLVKCFNISYKKYYGEISKVKYDSLMASLKIMLIKRFNQRNDTNKTLNSWKELEETVFGLINSKKASLFVIYSNNNPIQISLQYHFDEVMHAAIPGYDIDYQKFGIGNIAKYEQIMWCLENNYKFFELGYGDLEFKRIWSNYIYNFKHQIFYSNQSIFSIIIGNLEFLKISFKEYLKSKDIDKHVEKIKSNIFKQNTDRLNSKCDCDYDVLELDKIDSYKDLDKIGFHNHSQLKKITIDFQYTSMEHADDITIYKVLTEKDVYIIIGKNKIQKVSFK